MNGIKFVEMMTRKQEQEYYKNMSYLLKGKIFLVDKKVFPKREDALDLARKESRENLVVSLDDEWLLEIGKLDHNLYWYFLT